MTRDVKKSHVRNEHSLTTEQREAKRKKDRHWRQQDRNCGPPKEQNKEPKPPKKDPVPQKCECPVDILSMLKTSSAQLLVAEEARPLVRRIHYHQVLAHNIMIQWYKKGHHWTLTVIRNCWSSYKEV